MPERTAAYQKGGIMQHVFCLHISVPALSSSPSSSSLWSSSLASVGSSLAAAAAAALALECFAVAFAVGTAVVPVAARSSASAVL